MKTALLFVSLALYGLACALPAYKVEKGDDYLGIACLMMGGLSFMYNMTAFTAWLANIPYIVASFSNYFKNTGMFVITLQIIGIIASFSAFYVKEVLINEAGTTSKASLSYGGYLWIGSMVLMLMVSFLKDDVHV